MKLTPTDMLAVRKGDANYILGKGSNCYMNEDFKNAVDYYHLASSMGSIQATCNLGYCYLYGREVEQNTDLAISYFELAADEENIEASYKLGDIYSSDKWGLKDSEMSLYYYRMAASYMIGEDWGEKYTIAYTDKLQEFPSLCFALGREHMPSGNLRTDVAVAYQFLKHAEKGYINEIRNGADFYQKAYMGVIERLEDEIFDDIRAEYDPLFEEENDYFEYV